MPARERAPGELAAVVVADSAGATVQARPAAAPVAGGRGQVVPRRAPTFDALESGLVIDGFEVVRLLGAGGFGAVYHVRDRAGREAALKVLHAPLVAQPGAIARFQREVDAVRAVRHPGLPTVYAVGRLPDRRPYVLLELLEGEDLQSRLRRGRLSASETLAILEPLAEALAAAHAHGVVHRDLKPSNVFLARRADGSERVVLLDFGVAKLLDAGGAALTLTGQRLGTPCCMAPEQITGGRIDARTDVYGLGVLLHLVLTGRRPYAAESPTEMLFLQRCALPPRPSTRASLPPGVDDVVLAALAVDPDARPAGAAELCAAFRAAVAPGAGGPTRVRGRAVAVIVDAVAAPGAGDDDAVIDDVDGVLARAAAHFSAEGLRLVGESSRKTVLLGLVDGAAGLDEDALCARVSAAIDAFAAWLATRPGASAKVTVRLGSAIGEAELEAGRLVGGDLLDA